MQNGRPIWATAMATVLFSTLWFALAGWAQSVKDDAGRDLLPQKWFESATGICRIGLTKFADTQGWPGMRPFPITDPEAASARLDKIRDQGFQAIEVFAPSEGKGGYGGLDVVDFYRPAAGTMDDFRRLVRMAHQKGLAVTILHNVGYSSLAAPFFLKACDDVREGRTSREASWFLWSDRMDAPPPEGYATGDDVPNVTSSVEEWAYSDRAKKCYWTKWPNCPDADGRRAPCPQFNWSSPEWLKEVEKIARFWMDTGIDGMEMDCTFAYAGYKWETGRRYLTDVVASYGNAYLQAEGPGGHDDDAVAWISEGGWNSVQDFMSRGLFSRRDGGLTPSRIESETPAVYEGWLRDHRDRVVAAGGVVYYADWSRSFRSVDNPQGLMVLAAALFTGNLLSLGEPEGPINPNVKWLFETKKSHPALHQTASRRRLATANNRHYAFVATSANGSDRVLVVMNMTESRRPIEVDLTLLAHGELVNLENGETLPHQRHLNLTLPAYGYRAYQVKPPARIP